MEQLRPANNNFEKDFDNNFNNNLTRIFLKSGRVNACIHVLAHIISVDALRNSQNFFQSSGHVSCRG